MIKRLNLKLRGSCSNFYFRNIDLTVTHLENDAHFYMIVHYFLDLCGIVADFLFEIAPDGRYDPSGSEEWAKYFYCTLAFFIFYSL